MGSQLALPKGAQLPIFGPYLLRPNGCMDQDATWYGGRPRPGDFVLDGDPAPPSPKTGQSPTKFLGNVRCGQMAGWTKMPLGMEVGLGHGDFVFSWDPARLTRKGTPTPTQFLAHVCCGRTAGWIH